MNVNEIRGATMSKFFTFLLQYELKCLKKPMSDEFRNTKWAFLSKTSWLDIILERIQDSYRSANLNQLRLPSIHRVSLDIFTFYVVFRALLDDIANLTRYFYPKIIYQLPQSFEGLKTHKLLKDSDPDFVDFVNDKIPKTSDLVGIRDDMLHHRAGILPLPRERGRMTILVDLSKQSEVHQKLRKLHESREIFVEYKMDFDKILEELRNELKSLQHFYLEHFPIKLQESFPNFKIDELPADSGPINEFIV